MILYFVDSKGQKRVICEADDVADMIEPMMAHKAKRNIFSSGPFSLPGPMDPNSCYILNQEPNGCHYEVANEVKNFTVSTCDVNNAM